MEAQKEFEELKNAQEESRMKRPVEIMELKKEKY